MDSMNLISLKRVPARHTHTNTCMKWGGWGVPTFKKAVTDPFILFAGVTLCSNLQSIYTCTKYKRGCYRKKKYSNRFQSFEVNINLSLTSVSKCVFLLLRAAFRNSQVIMKLLKPNRLENPMLIVLAKKEKKERYPSEEEEKKQNKKPKFPSPAWHFQTPGGDSFHLLLLYQSKQMGGPFREQSDRMRLKKLEWCWQRDLRVLRLSSYSRATSGYCARQ